MPIISAMGVECAIIPTSILSTHTGGFEGWTFRDLSDDIPKIKEHWKKCKIKQVADAYNGDRSSNYPSGDDIVAEGVPFITSNNLNAIVLTTQIEKNKFQSM